jgi:magnesium chelatase family protein
VKSLSGACGFFNNPMRECRCTPLRIQRYVGRVSGPLLDRTFWT